MKKKTYIILAICIALIVALVIAICAGTKTDTNDTPQDPFENYTPEEFEQLDTEIIESVRMNGSLPSVENLTEAEKRFYKKEVINAISMMDIEMLKLYLDEASIKVFEEIENDLALKDMFKDTFGDVMYLENTDMIGMKDPIYIYAQWYTNESMMGVITAESISELSESDARSICSQYYSNAPYTFGKAGDCDITVVDGYIKFNIEHLFENTHVKSIYDLIPSSGLNPYVKLLFADLEEDLSHSDSQQSIIWNQVYEFDIQSIINYMENQTKTEEQKEIFEKYYKDFDNQMTIENWKKENIEIYKGANNIYMFINTPTKYIEMSEQDIPVLSNKKVYKTLTISTEEDIVTVFCELAKTMESWNLFN